MPRSSAEISRGTARIYNATAIEVVTILAAWTHKALIMHGAPSLARESLQRPFSRVRIVADRFQPRANGHAHCARARTALRRRYPRRRGRQGQCGRECDVPERELRRQTRRL